MALPPNYYELFGLTAAASDEQIRLAYKRLASEHHPDRSGTPESAARFKAASDAYHVLKDERRRARYDSLLLRVQARAQQRAASGSTSTHSLAKKSSASQSVPTPSTRPIDPVEKARREKAKRELERFLHVMGDHRKTDHDWKDFVPPILSRLGAVVLTGYFLLDWRIRGNVFEHMQTGSLVHDRLLLIVLVCLLGIGLLLVFGSGRIARHDLPSEVVEKTRDPEAFYWQSGWMLLLAAPFLVNFVRSLIV